LDRARDGEPACRLLLPREEGRHPARSRAVMPLASRGVCGRYRRASLQAVEAPGRRELSRTITWCSCRLTSPARFTKTIEMGDCRPGVEAVICRLIALLAASLC
jgi:hypothetical protein